MKLKLADDLALPLDAVTQTFLIVGKPTEVQIAWAAGLFEGEGCICFGEIRGRAARQRHGNYWRGLTLLSTDEDVVRTFAAVVGRGVIRVRDPKPPRKRAWRWEVRRWRDVKAIAELLFPFFHSRRRAKALALLATPPVRQGFCLKGHPLYGPDADVYTSPRYPPKCAICQRARTRAAHARRRGAA